MWHPLPTRNTEKYMDYQPLLPKCAQVLSHLYAFALDTLFFVSPHTELFLASLHQSFRSKFNCHFWVELSTNLSGSPVCPPPVALGIYSYYSSLTDDFNLLADLPSRVNHGLSFSSESLVPSTILGFRQATRKCLLNKRTSDWGLWRHQKMDRVTKEENKATQSVRKAKTRMKAAFRSRATFTLLIISCPNQGSGGFVRGAHLSTRSRNVQWSWKRRKKSWKKLLVLNDVRRCTVK